MTDDELAEADQLSFTSSAADLADGAADGTISLSLISDQTGSYRFSGSDIADGAGHQVAVAGDFSDDGLPDLMVMGSAGGVLDVPGALAMPAAAVESGPAAGVIAAQLIGRQLCSVFWWSWMVV